VLVTGVKMINGPNWMNLITDSKNVTFSNISISDVSTSTNPVRNTDGWDTYRSSDIVIKDSVIHNGDDCVSFKPNSTNIVVSNLDCTGSHGISVGSLGQYPGVVDIVQNIVVENIKMTSASNGVRIKTWAGPNVGSGLVKNITYHNFWNNNVQLPVTIDQCYGTSAALCASNPSNTLIQDIFFKNITGTASGAVVAQLGCSPGDRCGVVRVDDLAIK
jgi:galacturan 1,4-alpha-galacturonidase